MIQDEELREIEYPPGVSTVALVSNSQGEHRFYAFDLSHLVPDHAERFACTVA